MTYRLKDKELQRKLDDISNGDFSVQLQKVSDTMLSSLTGPGVHFGGLARVVDDRFRNLAPRFTFRFHADEVEEAREPDIKEGIKNLREIFDWIEKDLDNNEPNEVEMRWMCAKSIIHTLNEHIEDYVKEQEQTE